MSGPFNHPVIAMDSFQLRVTEYGAALLPTRSIPGGQNPNERMLVGELTMSPMLMKVLAIKLKKFLREHEDNFGPIHIPERTANGEGISLQEDWA